MCPITQDLWEDPVVASHRELKYEAEGVFDADKTEIQIFKYTTLKCILKSSSFELAQSMELTATGSPKNRKDGSYSQ